MTIVISMIGGHCPMQAEGTIDGVPFYFRARGRDWSMGIGQDPVGIPHPSEIRTEPPYIVDADEWYCLCTWGTEPFAAGWMEESEARRLISWCAEEYLRQKKPAAGGASEAQVSLFSEEHA